MAHLRDLIHWCARCRRPATVQLYNSRNAVMGYYCTRHGYEALKDLQREEARTAKEATSR